MSIILLVVLKSCFETTETVPFEAIIDTETVSTWTNWLEASCEPAKIRKKMIHDRTLKTTYSKL